MDAMPSLASRCGWRICAAAGLLAALLAGCADKHRMMAPSAKSPLEPPPGAVSARELAAHLRMTVVDFSDCHVVLRDGANVISIYSDPMGQAFVNGRKVGAGGGIVAVAGTIYVSPELESQIRSALKQPLAAAPVPAPRAPKAPRPPRKGAAGPAAEATPAVSGKVVIDAGHGGKDPGAHSTVKVGGRTLDEKDITLAVATMVAERLRRAGVTVTMTRQDDTFISLEERYTISNRSGADLFLALHCDSLPAKPDERGFACWLAPSASGASVTAADCIAKRLTSVSPDRGAKRNRYQVLINNLRPAVLLEMGFLSNSGEAQRLGNSLAQAEYAEAIASGVIDYLLQK